MGNRYEKTAQAIIARAGAAKLRPYEPPTPKAEPEPRPLATTLANAYRDGFDDAATISGECCGCNVTGINPYDGSEV